MEIRRYLLVAFRHESWIQLTRSRLQLYQCGDVEHDYTHQMLHNLNPDQDVEICQTWDT